MGNNAPWHHLYQTARWSRIRRRQLAAFPLCIECLKQNKIEAATDVDHVVAHKGKEAAFWNGKLQSLCRSHHARKSNEEAGNRLRPTIGEDGWPIPSGPNKHQANEQTWWGAGFK